MTTTEACPGWSGVHVYADDGRYDECPTCGRRWKCGLCTVGSLPFHDPDNTGGNMDSMVLAEPTVRNGDRSIRLDYPTGKTNEDGTIVAQVYVGHSPNQKVFFASLKSVTLRDEAGYSVESFMVFSGVSLAKERVTRYSAKALAAFAEKVRTEVLPGVLATNPEAAAIMAGGNGDHAGRILNVGLER